MLKSSRSWGNGVPGGKFGVNLCACLRCSTTWTLPLLLQLLRLALCEQVGAPLRTHAHHAPDTLRFGFPAKISARKEKDRRRRKKKGFRGTEDIPFWRVFSVLYYPFNPFRIGGLVRLFLDPNAGGVSSLFECGGLFDSLSKDIVNHGFWSVNLGEIKRAAKQTEVNCIILDHAYSNIRQIRPRTPISHYVRSEAVIYPRALDIHRYE